MMPASGLQFLAIVEKKPGKIKVLTGLEPRPPRYLMGAITS